MFPGKFKLRSLSSKVISESKYCKMGRTFEETEKIVYHKILREIRNKIFNHNDSVLGTALCDLLLKNNCTVCVTKSSKRSQDEELSSLAKYKEYHLNTCNYDEVQSLKEAIESSLGCVDVVIILAPDIPETTMFDAQDTGFPQIVGEVIKSYYWAIKSFSAGMIENRKGHVVGIVPFCEKSDPANVLRRSVMGLLNSFRSELTTFQRDYISVTHVNNYCFRMSSLKDESQVAKRIFFGIKAKSDVINIYSDKSKKRCIKEVGTFLHNLILLLLELFLVPMKTLLFSIFGRKVRKDIRNQVALVTGGGMGLGRQISLSLGKQGCRVVIADIDYESAQTTADMLKKLHVEAKAYRTDISDPKDVAQLKLDIIRDWGKVDILVNNAGLMPVGNVMQAKATTVEKTIDVNILSHFTIVNAFLPDMIKSRRGHIIAISSLAGLFPLPAGVIYCTSKYGVIGFMDSLELELKSTGNGFVKTTTVHPYFIRTRQDLEYIFRKDKIARTIPWLNADDVAEKVVDAILENKRRVLIPNIKYLLLLVMIQPKFCEKFLYGTILKGVNDLRPEGNILT